MSELSRKFGISKEKLYKLLRAMHDAFIITIVRPYRAEGRGKSKFFFYDPALYENTGNIREALFVSVMRSLGVPVYASKDEEKGDFVILPKGKPIYVEIGGRRKNPKGSDIVFRDDILYPEREGESRVLPLWTLGFMW